MNTTTNTTTALIREKAPLILAEIQKAKSILLHCHPSPDPDSVGSALAMKFAVEQLGKRATVIKGDSDIPHAFMHFPGAKDIVMKSWWEIDLDEYDLFIIVDSSITGVSRVQQAIPPSTMKIINIDHHRTNDGSGSINIVDPTYPATGQLLFDVFTAMGVEITTEIATNLFMGIYSDTGGFKYEGTSQATFSIAARLVAKAPNFCRIISHMENSSTVDDLRFQGIALSNIEILSKGKVALAIIPYSEIEKNNIPDVSITAGVISSILRRIGSCNVVGVIIEARPNKIKMSFRAQDAQKNDVSKLAVALGGGGHKAAAGAACDMPLAEAKQKVVEKIKELYNL